MAKSETQSAAQKVRERAALAGVDLDRIPKHVAVIMDGNGRWAQKRGMPRLLGHRQGYNTLRDVLRTASQIGIEYLTVYGFSAENWRRPEDEVGGLMRLINEAAQNELKTLHDENVRVLVAGRLHQLPEFLQRSLQDLVETTRNNSGITFTLAINYGGRAEIVDACRALAASGIDPASITEEAFAEHLYCPGVPDPDLLVRTAGEMRWSNFLIWQSAYAELFVTQKTWPEFDEALLIEAILHFQARNRKFGGL